MSANVTVPGARRINVEGDDESQGQIQIPPADAPTYQLVVSNADQTYQAMTQTTSAYAIGKWTVGVHDPIGPVYPDQLHIYSRRSRSKVAGSEAPGWVNLIVPKLQASLDGPGEFQQGENAGSNTYSVSVFKIQSYPNGVALSAANEGTTGASAIEIWTDYPLAMHMYRGNGSTTTTTLTYTPAGTHLTDYIKVWKDGVALVATTDFTVSGSVVTYAVAPAAAAKVDIWYEATTLP
jgi:hypothetical protein